MTCQWGFYGYNTESLIVEFSGYRVLKVPRFICWIHISSTLERVDPCSRYKRQILSSIPISVQFSSGKPGFPISRLCCIIIYCWIYVRENRQDGQSRMDNPEKQETMDTRQTNQNTKYRKRKRWATRTQPRKPGMRLGSYPEYPWDMWWTLGNQ